MQRLHNFVLSMLLQSWAAIVYFLAEVAWKTLRGRPDTIHWTMLLLSYILAAVLERCGSEVSWKTPLPVQGLLCGTCITIAEFCAGCVLNLWLGLDIWDYTGLPLNLLGQVCVPFWLLWCAVSMPAIVALDWLRYWAEGGERPHYIWK